MKVQEAIHCMKFVTEEEVCEECPIYGETGTDHCFQDAHRLAIEALEKQKPKKPKMVQGFMTVFHCPICESVIQFKQTYCDDCGQKLDWSKEDEKVDAIELSLNNLNLSTRSYNCLRRAGINSIKDLCNRTPDDMIRIRDLGRKSLDEIIQKMETHGLKFRTELEEHKC